jgi:hypothetical protein
MLYEGKYIDGCIRREALSYTKRKQILIQKYTADMYHVWAR